MGVNLDCISNIFCVNQTSILFFFGALFGFWHHIFRKKVNVKHAIILFVVFVLTIINKNDFVFWFDNIDVTWHLNPLNIHSGFPAFFVFNDLINYLFFGLSFYLLPLIFCSATMYVFLVWLNQKKINLIVFLFLFFFLFKEFMLFISFSRETIVILFSLLFFYFLEKHYSKNSRLNLITATLFLVLACLTKITGFLLIPFYLWVLMQKKRSNYYLIPITLILSFMLFKTNLAANLHAGDVVITASQLIAYFFTFFNSYFILYAFVFFPLFFKPKKFLWQLNVYVLLLVFVVGIKTYFLSNSSIVLTLQRYLVIFVLPLILWLSNETQIAFNEFKLKYKKRSDKMDRKILYVLGLIALSGWALAGFFYLEADGLHQDCKGIIPAVQATVDYYERVCSEDIEREKLTELLRQKDDLNFTIKS